MQNKQLNNANVQTIIQTITTLNLNEVYNEYVDPRIVKIIKEKVDEYNALVNYDMADVKLYRDLDEMKRAKCLEILYSSPCGFKQIEQLPYFKELVLGEKE